MTGSYTEPTTCSSGTLRDDDVAMLAALGIAADIIAAAGVRRVTHDEARDVCGVQHRGADNGGIAFPYRDPTDERIIRSYRVRRDNPEREPDGSPIAKYLIIARSRPRLLPAWLR